MDGGVISGISAAIVLVLGAIYKLFYHFKCSSNCCGNKSSVAVDLGTPPKSEPLVSEDNNNDN